MKIDLSLWVLIFGLFFIGGWLLADFMQKRAQGQRHPKNHLIYRIVRTKTGWEWKSQYLFFLWWVDSNRKPSQDRHDQETFIKGDY